MERFETTTDTTFVNNHQIDFTIVEDKIQTGVVPRTYTVNKIDGEDVQSFDFPDYGSMINSLERAFPAPIVKEADTATASASASSELITFERRIRNNNLQLFIVEKAPNDFTIYDPDNKPVIRGDYDEITMWLEGAIWMLHSF